MNKYLLMFLILCAGNAYSQPTWEVRTKRTFTVYENNDTIRQSISIPSSNTFYIILRGEDNTDVLMKTTDRGAYWRHMPLPWTGFRKLRNVYFINDLTGFVTCNLTGNLVKTTNGGESWTFLQNISGIHQIFFLNSNTGWLSCGTSGYKTTNGGDNWTPDSFVKKRVQFINANTGFTKAANGILKTTDGGATSTLIQTIGSPTNYLVDFGFKDANTGYAFFKEEFYVSLGRTTNGGNTWQLIMQASSGVYLLSNFHFRGNDTIYAMDRQRQVARSTNGGYNWSGYTGATDYCVNNETEFHHIGNLSVGGGYQFKYINEPDYITGSFGLRGKINLDILNNNVYLKGENYYIGSSNSGNSWTINVQQNVPESGKIQVMPSNTVLAQISSRFYIYSSEYYFPAGANQSDFHFINEQTGWSCGSLILRSTTGGTNWTTQLNTGAYYNAIRFLDANTGFVVGNGGAIIKTTTGGLSWFPQTSGSIMELRSIQFINPQTGYICGSAGVVIKTTNAGTNWTIYDTGTLTQLNCIWFKNAQTGYAVGSAGTMLISTNGGINWSNHTVATEDLYSIKFINDQTGWISGDKGLSLRTTTGGLVNVNQVSNETPAKYSLEQNYPNPFNPVTKIRFSIPVTSFAKLAVYDILGREVKILFNRQFTAGEYEETFDAAGLAGGIYFYTLRTDSYIETKKMMVVK